jgi:predicted transcriptional regulator
MDELGTKTETAAVEGKTAAIALTSEIVSAFVSNNPVPVAELSALIKSVYDALVTTSVAAGKPTEPEKPVPAISVKKSVTADYIVCLEDGKKLKMLKRHLSSTYGMTPDEYRAKWGLPSDYPMVAPNYAAQRSSLAKSIGLGRKPVAAPEPTPVPTKRSGRPRKSAA